MDQIIYIDFETTDLINKSNRKFPYILEFSAQDSLGANFATYVTPDDSEFSIAEKATEVHGITKESLLLLPKSQRPSFAQAWKDFLIWLSNLIIN